MEFTCEYCNKNFFSNKRKVRFCSGFCNHKWRYKFKKKVKEYCEKREELNKKKLCGMKRIIDEEYCECERPPRKIICQKKKGHKNSCHAGIFWEKKNE